MSIKIIHELQFLPFFFFHSSQIVSVYIIINNTVTIIESVTPNPLYH